MRATVWRFSTVAPSNSALSWCGSWRGSWQRSPLYAAVHRHLFRWQMPRWPHSPLHALSSSSAGRPACPQA
jgi:hypothetical protein